MIRSQAASRRIALLRIMNLVHIAIVTPVPPFGSLYNQTLLALEKNEGRYGHKSAVGLSIAQCVGLAHRPGPSTDMEPRTGVSINVTITSRVHVSITGSGLHA